VFWLVVGIENARAGFPFISRAWFVLVVPVATPGPVVTKLRESVARVIGTNEFRAKYLEPNGWDSFPLHGNALQEFIVADRKEYEARVALLGQKLE
jgi:tripartite-type tricarboxylate transporter receptor subunit TctC